jgi:hypothetical protein
VSELAERLRRVPQRGAVAWIGLRRGHDEPMQLVGEARAIEARGRAQDQAYAVKRNDYFEAGTMVVWDVDPLAQTVTKYTEDGTILFAVGDVADAEPAVPGWTIAVADVFSDA